VDDSSILEPDAPSVAEAQTIVYGPNIKPFPKGRCFGDSVTAQAVLKVGDNITTDHIMPAGAKVLPFRSNIPRMSDFCFTACDPSFPERARRTENGIIIGGSNYGQGSSREHAALVPMYLGIRAVIAKSFARIHAANLVNAGILPLTFEDPSDYDTIDQGDLLVLKSIPQSLSDHKFILENRTKGSFINLSCQLSPRQQKIVLAGGLLNAVKEDSNV